EIERCVGKRQRARVRVDALGLHLAARLVKELYRDVERRDTRAAASRLAAEPAAAAADVEHGQVLEIAGSEQFVEHDLQPPPQIVRVDQLVEAIRDRVVKIQLWIAGRHEWA